MSSRHRCRPARYELAGDMLATAADRSEQTGAPMRETLIAVAEARGHDLGSPELPLVDTLTSVGYAPAACADGGYRLTNCPFHRLATRHTTLICSANTAFVRGLVDESAEQRDVWLERTAGECCVRIGTRDRRRASRPTRESHVDTANDPTSSSAPVAAAVGTPGSPVSRSSLRGRPGNSVTHFASSADAQLGGIDTEEDRVSTRGPRIDDGHCRPDPILAGRDGRGFPVLGENSQVVSQRCALCCARSRIVRVRGVDEDDGILVDPTMPAHTPARRRPVASAACRRRILRTSGRAGAGSGPRGAPTATPRARRRRTPAWPRRARRHPRRSGTCGRR